MGVKVAMVSTLGEEKEERRKASSNRPFSFLLLFMTRMMMLCLSALFLYLTFGFK